MKSRFALPVAVALTLDAVVLFCFNTPAPASAGQQKLPTPQTFVVPMDDFAAPLPSDDDAGGAPSATHPAPTLPEPPQLVDSTRIPVTVPATQPGSEPAVRIEPGAIGPLHAGALYGSGILPYGLLDNSPRVRLQVPPKYPEEARSRGEKGDVVVEFGVDEGGRVFDPRIVISSDPVFEAATLRAVSQWRFEPGRSNGRMVRYRMIIKVAFEVDLGLSP